MEVHLVSFINGLKSSIEQTLRNVLEAEKYSHSQEFIDVQKCM